MRCLPYLALPLMAVLAMGCRAKHPRVPAWVASAPARSQMALSGQAGWLLEQPQFQKLIAQYPLAEQSLDLFLKKARINPHDETGRMTFYAMDLKLEKGSPNVESQAPNFLLQFGGFKDPKALQWAIAESFPPEGALQIKGLEMPLHVVMDYNQLHIRVLVDQAGNLWLGDLSALTALESAGQLPPRHPVIAAASWINGAAPIQGFLRPQDILKDLSGRLPGDLAKELPQGIDCLAWSVTPGTGPNALHRLEIAITGTREGILQVTPWLQRLVAVANSVQTPSSQAPELLQETTRAGLRCQLTQEQLNMVFSKLAQPNFTFSTERTPLKS